METCPNCNRKLSEVVECDQCMYVHDYNLPEQAEELDFNEEKPRQHEREHGHDVYDEAHLLEEKSHE